MLTQLAIRDLALVEALELELGPGLNVLTGETGAGKSAVVGALGLLLGAKASGDVVRGGCAEARVQGRFALAPGSVAARRLAELGISGPVLEVERSVRATGRGRAWIDGRPAKRSELAEVVGSLVDLTGQHAQVGLLSPEAPLELLDGFGGLESLREPVAAAHRELERLRRRRDAAGDEEELGRRMDFLRFQLEEIEGLELEPGERARLLEERSRLRHAEQICGGLAEAEGYLASGEPAALDWIGRAVRALEGVERFDAEATAEADRARSLFAEAEDLARALERRLRAVEVYPERLGAVEERLERIERVARRHGGEASLVEVAERLRAELDRLERGDEARSALDGAVRVAEGALEAAAAKLSEARRTVAPELERVVAEELAGLGMAGTVLEVELSALPEPGSRGGERVDLRIAPNRGEAPRPLRRVASGGELARILLAMKAALAERAPMATQVFDEVDTGIGGTVAEQLGVKLAGLARGGQVVAITHLAPVAAFADRHFRVRKVERDGRTVTEVRRLDPDETLEELGRMLGGAGPSTRALAEELRRRAKGAPVVRLPTGRSGGGGRRQAVG